jgi:hypothetical protein
METPSSEGALVTAVLGSDGLPLHSHLDWATAAVSMTA